MKKFMLRTDTEDQMEDVLVSAGICSEVVSAEGEVFFVPKFGAAVDMIGPIPPKFNADREMYKAGDPRFHANVCISFDLTNDQEMELQAVAVDPEPDEPYRVFA